MPSAAFAFRKGVFARLSADPALTALIGAGRVHDEPPRGFRPPAVILGEGGVKDSSTLAVKGHEHRLTLAAWSAQGGAKEAFAIADAVVAALETMPATLDGHRLVNCVALATDLSRERDGTLTRALVRIRAVTEAV